ncbi:CopG family transcriptional regulator [Candidatus Micrarchaeota archaeon]|nr:CopG family transcriptional regulator [Candidatus Micrarchaeota archaeon]
MDLKEKIQVSIPQEMYDKIKEEIKGTEFNSVSEYVNFILAELLSNEDKGKKALDKKEEEEIKGRLKALGYLD